MSEDLTQGAPSAPEPAAPPPTLEDHAARALDIAYERRDKRAAGEDVPDALPTLTIPVKRDDKGKFAPQPKAKAPDLSVEPAPKPAEGDTSSAPPGAPEAAAETAPAQPALQPNARWNDAHKATFAKLPRDAQEAILGMASAQDADYTRKTQDLAEQRKLVEPFATALSDHGQFLQTMSQQIRQPPARIVGDVLQAYRQLTTGAPHEKAQTLAFMAQVAGIDLRSLVPSQGAQPGQPLPQQAQMHPAIEREILQLRQQTAELDRFRQDSLRDREQQSIHATQQQIDAFASAKDGAGQLKYPHFDAVRELMARHVEAGSSLEDAYAAAAKPITDAIAATGEAQRQAQQASDQQKRDAAKAAADAEAARVANARRGAGPRPVGSQPGMTKHASIEDNAWAALEKAGIR